MEVLSKCETNATFTIFLFLPLQYSKPCFAWCLGVPIRCWSKCPCPTGPVPPETYVEAKSGSMTEDHLIEGEEGKAVGEAGGEEAI